MEAPKNTAGQIAPFQFTPANNEGTKVDGGVQYSGTATLGSRKIDVTVFVPAKMLDKLNGEGKLSDAVQQTALKTAQAFILAETRYGSVNTVKYQEGKANIEVKKNDAEDVKSKNLEKLANKVVSKNLSGIKDEGHSKLVDRCAQNALNNFKEVYASQRTVESAPQPSMDEILKAMSVVNNDLSLMGTAQALKPDEKKKPEAREKESPPVAAKQNTLENLESQKRKGLPPTPNRPAQAQAKSEPPPLPARDDEGEFGPEPQPKASAKPPTPPPRADAFPAASAKEENAKPEAPAIQEYKPSRPPPSRPPPPIPTAARSAPKSESPETAEEPVAASKPPPPPPPPSKAKSPGAGAPAKRSTPPSSNTEEEKPAAPVKRESPTRGQGVNFDDEARTRLAQRTRGAQTPAEEESDIDEEGEDFGPPVEAPKPRAPIKSKEGVKKEDQAEITETEEGFNIRLPNAVRELGEKPLSPEDQLRVTAERMKKITDSKVQNEPATDENDPWA